MAHLIKNTHEFVEKLRHEDEVLDIEEMVDPNLELAEIQRRVVAKKGKAVLFHHVKGTAFKVVTNLFGSEKRINLAFSARPEQIIKQAVETAHTLFPPTFKKIWAAKNLAWNFLKVGMKKSARSPLLGCQLSGLNELPQIKSWPEDGGAFITLPLIYTEHPQTHISNLGMYRIQLYNKNQCGMHIQIHRGGGFHHHEAEKAGASLPVHVYIGGPPALTLSAIAPMPEDVPEILLASLMMGGRLKKIDAPHLSPLPILSDADFCLIGDIPSHERKPEGPFGDHYGYYSLQHDHPYVNIKKIFHRPNAIYPATVVGKPPQEDHYIACYLQELFKPLIQMVMPQVKQVWAFEESGVHSLAGAVVKDRYPREALTTALRILGEGQLSLSKVLMVTDQDCDVKDFKTFFQIILERLDLATDLFVLSNISQDTLDYTGPKLNEGSKAIFLGLGQKKRDLPKNFSGPLPSPFLDAQVFCPGALAISGPVFKNQDGLAQLLAKEASLADWPMVFLLDDARSAIINPQEFIWQVFTRFEPAADIHARETQTTRFHVALKPPVVIDCRLKPWYPKVLESDPAALENLKPVFKKYGLQL